MSGKGSKPRPFSVSNELFASNWDRAFSNKQGDLFPQELREVTHDGMWKHSCTMTMEVFYIGKEETCDYCGAWEEDGQ